MQEQEGKSVELEFHWQKNPAQSNLLSYFTEQSGWMLSVGLLVVHGTLLVDVIPHLLSWSNPWYTHTHRVSVDINKVKKLNHFFSPEFKPFFSCWIIVMDPNSPIYWMWMNSNKMHPIQCSGLYLCLDCCWN